MRLRAMTTDLSGSVTLQAPKGQTEATEQEFVGEGTLSKNLKMEGTNRCT